MKRLMIVLAALVFFCSFPFPSHGEDARSYTFDGSETVGNTGDALEDFFDSLPEEVRGLLPDGFAQSPSEALSVSGVLAGFFQNGLGFLLPSLGCAARLVSFLLLASLFYRFRDSVSGEGIRKALEFVVTAAGVVVILTMETGVLEAAARYVKLLAALMSAILTAVASTALASGAGHMAALAGTEMMLTVSGAAGLFSALILPLCCISMVLATAGSFGTVKTGSFLKAIHYTVTIAFSALGVVLGLLIAAEAKLAASADSLGMQGVKFAVSSFIPLVGGALSGAVGTITGSFSIIKNTIGAGGIVLIVLIAAPAFLNLFLNRLALLLGKSMADMLGCEREKAFLEEIGTVFSFVLAITAAVTFLFVLLVAVCLNMKLGGAVL